MTPSKQAKAAGLKSLAEVIEMTGVPKSTLNDWFRTRPRLFKIILFGCAKVNEKTNG